MVTGTASGSPDGQGVINPLAATLEIGSETKVAPPVRRFMAALPWSALAAAFIVSLRILAVAHLNLSIALQLVALTNTAQVLLGLAVIMFQSLLLVVALYVQLVCTETLSDVIKSMRSKKSVNISNRSLFFIFLWPPAAVLALAFFANTEGLLILVGLILWTFQRAWIDTKPSTQPAPAPRTTRKRSRGFRVILIITGTIMIGIGFGMVCLNDTPWLPPERILLTNEKVVVGYVVAQSGPELTVLLNSDRSLITLSTSQINSQMLCQLGGQFGGSDLFVRLVWKSSPNVPACATGQ